MWNMQQGSGAVLVCSDSDPGGREEETDVVPGSSPFSERSTLRQGKANSDCHQTIQLSPPPNFVRAKSVPGLVPL